MRHSLHGQLRCRIVEPPEVHRWSRLTVSDYVPYGIASCAVPANSCFVARGFPVAPQRVLAHPTILRTASLSKLISVGKWTLVFTTNESARAHIGSSYFLPEGGRH